MSTSSETPGAAMELPTIQIDLWQELARLGVMVMHLVWEVLWFRALVLWKDPVPLGRVFLFLAAVSLGAHVGARLMNFFRLKVSLRRVALAMWMVSAILIGLRSLLYFRESVSWLEVILGPLRALQAVEGILPLEIGVILVVLLVSWQGISLAQRTVGPTTVRASFRTGFLMFLSYVLIFTLVTQEAPRVPWLVFLSSGMLAIGAARVSTLSKLRGGRRTPLTRGWLAGMGLAVFGSVALAAGTASLLADVGAVLVGLLLQVVFGLLVLITAPFVLVALLLFYFVLTRFQLEDSQIFQVLEEGLARLDGLVTTLSQTASRFDWLLEALAALWARWGPLLRLVTCSGVLLILAAVILLRLRDRRVRQGRVVSEEVGETSLPEDLLGALKNGLLGRLQAMGDRISGFGGRRQRRQRRIAAHIRRVYASLLDLAEDLDQPRRRDQTPLEYRPVLKNLFPGHEAEIEILTDAYVRVRYGEIPESVAEIEQVDQAWERIQAAGRQMVRARRARRSGIANV